MRRVPTTNERKRNAAFLQGFQGVPTTNERKRNAAFLQGFQGDIYICTILKEKILHSVYHEQCYSTKRKAAYKVFIKNLSVYR